MGKTRLIISILTFCFWFVSHNGLIAGISDAENQEPSEQLGNKGSLSADDASKQTQAVLGQMERSDEIP